MYALGVIFANMLSGSNLWARADPSDECFAAFLRRGAEYLRRVLPVSRAGADLLAQMLEIDPEKRITLSELRRALSSVGTLVRPADAEDLVPRKPRKCGNRRCTPGVPRAQKAAAAAAAGDRDDEVVLKPDTAPCVEVQPATPAVEGGDYFSLPKPLHADTIPHLLAVAPSTSAPSLAVPSLVDDLSDPSSSVSENASQSTKDHDSLNVPVNDNTKKVLDWQSGLEPDVLMAIRALRVDD